GSSGARNAGIREASGDYIALLDSDDLWDPRFLESQVAFAHTNDAALVYASYRLINEEGAEIMSPYHVKQQVTYTDLLKQNDIGCLTALYCVRKIGKQYLNENLGSVRDDFELWLRILKEISLAYGNNEILASYRVMKSSTTGNKIKMLIPQWKVYRESEKLSFFLSVYYLLRWAVAGIMKYRKSFTS
ncbi:MAG: glycosyltransferase family 2 protein, partial [Spirochaetota bacterium]